MCEERTHNEMAKSPRPNRYFKTGQDRRTSSLDALNPARPSSPLSQVGALMSEQPCHRFSAMPLMDWSYQILGSVEMDLRSTSICQDVDVHRPGRRPQGWDTV